MSANGQRFLVNLAEMEAPRPSITLIDNWHIPRSKPTTKTATAGCC
jgi:hypothetical protein